MKKWLYSGFLVCITGMLLGVDAPLYSSGSLTGQMEEATQKATQAVASSRYQQFSSSSNPSSSFFDEDDDVFDHEDH